MAMERASAALKHLADTWARAKGRDLDLETLLELRARSRAFAFACPATSAADRTVDLENWAELLYLEAAAGDASRRAQLEREIDDTINRLRFLVPADTAV